MTKCSKEKHRSFIEYGYPVTAQPRGCDGGGIKRRQPSILEPPWVVCLWKFRLKIY